jgi:hypothetical protein
MTFPFDFTDIPDELDPDVMVIYVDAPLRTREDRHNHNLAGRLKNAYPGRKKLSMLYAVSDYFAGVAQQYAEMTDDDLETGTLDPDNEEMERERVEWLRRTGMEIYDLARRLEQLRKVIRP